MGKQWLLLAAIVLTFVTAMIVVAVLAMVLSRLL
jgi:hypothetical protein